MCRNQVDSMDCCCYKDAETKLKSGFVSLNFSNFQWPASSAVQGLCVQEQLQTTRCFTIITIMVYTKSSKEMHKLNIQRSTSHVLHDHRRIDNRW